MSVQGCFTDFHIDFGGTSVWYHILRGGKVSLSLQSHRFQDLPFCACTQDMLKCHWGAVIYQSHCQNKSESDLPGFPDVFFMSLWIYWLYLHVLWPVTLAGVLVDSTLSTEPGDVWELGVIWKAGRHLFGWQMSWLSEDRAEAGKHFHNPIRFVLGTLKWCTYRWSIHSWICYFCNFITIKSCFFFSLSLFFSVGWIHAVYTPEDTLVFGGNFLHSFNIPMQLNIYSIEDRTRVSNSFVFSTCWWLLYTLTFFCVVSRQKDW